MASDSLGLATLQIGLSAKGIEGDLERELSPMLQQIGGRAGRDLSDSIGQGVRQGSASIESALDRILSASGDQGGRRAGQNAADSMAQGIRQSSSGIESALDRAVQSGGETGGRRAGQNAAQGMAQGVRQGSPQVENALERVGQSGGQSAGRVGGDAMGAGILGGVKGKLGGAAGLAAALGAIVGAAGIKAAGIFVDALRDGLDREASLDLTQARLGTDDATMAKYGEAAGGAFSNAFGESFEANLDTARMATQGGLIDTSDDQAAIQGVIEKLTTVNDVIKGDMMSTTQAASVLMRSGLAESADSAFDVIAGGYLKLGDLSGDLFDSLTQYAAGWKNSGFEITDTLALIDQSLEKGAPNTDAAADALREFGRRLPESRDDIVEALESIGLAGEDMYASFLVGGEEGFRAFDMAFDKIRATEDPALRYNAVLGLLGDTAGDFAEVWEQWDPSEAVAKFGQVDGAADQMIQTVGSNAQSSITAALNSISQAGDGVKLALAQAFSPALSEFAGWVKQHQPELIGFFGFLAQAALASGQGIAEFSAVVLDSFGVMLEGLDWGFGNLAGKMGDFAESLGLQGVADKLHGFEAGLENGATKMHEWADGARGMGDRLGEMRQGLNLTVEQMQSAAEVTQALTGTVNAIPLGKKIVIETSSDQARQALEEIGLVVTNLPDGTTEVTANTAEGQAVLDAWIRQANASRAEVQIDAHANITSVTYQGRTAQAYIDEHAGISGSATGGLIRGPGGPTSDSILRWLSNGEYVVNADATSKNLPLIEAINQGWTPSADRLHQMVPGMATGGLAAAQAFAQSKDDLPYLYGAVGPDAYDCSGFQSDIYAALTGKPTGTRYFTTESDFESLGFVPGIGGPDDYSIGILRGGGGPNSHMAGTLGGVNVEAGSNGVQVGSGAQGAADLPLQYHLPLLGDPGGSGGGGSLGSLGGSSLGGGSGVSVGGAGGISQGTPVYVTNWPGSYSGTDAETGVVQSDGFGAQQLQGAPMGRSLTDPMGLQAPMQPPTDPNAQAFGAGPATDPMVQKHLDFFQNLGQQGINFVGENWREMLNTAVGVGLGNARVGGGDTYNISGDPRSIATAIARNQARKTRAMQIRGGYGRP